jgi:hypothetical protein
MNENAKQLLFAFLISALFGAVTGAIAITLLNWIGV